MGSEPQIRMLDLPAIHREIEPRLTEAILSVIEKDLYVLGAAVETFEQQFAEYCSAKFCVGVGNGLDALILALRSLGIGQGDEVLVPSHTFIATWLAVTAVGATPVPVPTSSHGYNIDIESISGLVTKRTRAVIPVHLYGAPVAMDELLRICRGLGVSVIEDAAQAHGATIESRRIGSHSDIVAWSFYPWKNLGALGDGGCVTTNDPELAEKVRVMRNYGSKTKYRHDSFGFNSRLDSIQAAVLSEKLRCLDSWNGRRRDQAMRYFELLAELPLGLPSQVESVGSSWHLFVVTTNKRDEIQRLLKGFGIETGIHYPLSPAYQPVYKHFGYCGRTETKRAQLLAETVISLPIGPHLTLRQIETVSAALTKAVLQTQD